MGEIMSVADNGIPLIFGQNVTSFQVRKTGCANQLLREENRTRMLNSAVTEKHAYDNTVMGSQE